MANTSPDLIYYADIGSPGSPVAISAGQASSVQAAFDKRSRYSYSWPTQSGRTNQAGMIEGATGYQIDTRTEYIYESGIWRLATPHAEFYASITNYASGTLNGIGDLQFDQGSSTSSSFVAAFAPGTLNVVSPGIYAVSSVSTNVLTANLSTVSPATGRSFVDLSKVNGAGDQQRVSITVGEDRGSLSKPNLYIGAPNTKLYFNFFFTTGANVSTFISRVSITRLG